MDPLVHGLSLLANAVKTNRVSHFQPSTACIISCVRSVLSATDMLLREAPLLQKFPVLAQERRKILSVLALLVAQAKKASEDFFDETSQEMEIEAMMRLAGQVFARVRAFLNVAVQYGVELPDRRPSSPDLEYPKRGHSRRKLSVDSISDSRRPSGDHLRRPSIDKPYQSPKGPRAQLRASVLPDGRARSLSDVRMRKGSISDDNVPLVPSLLKT